VKKVFASFFQERRVVFSPEKTQKNFDIMDWILFKTFMISTGWMGKSCLSFLVNAWCRRAGFF
jgi:hypothetical protein